MQRDTTRRTLLGGIATAGSAALAGCSGVTPFVGRRLERSETVDPGDAETIAVHGGAGRVTVAGSDVDEIHLEIEKQSSSIRTDLEELDLRTDRSDDLLEFRSEWEGTEGLFQSRPTMNLDATVPRDVSLETVRTSVGRVTVRDVVGDLAVDTNTGRVDVSGVEGAVGVTTNTGRVEVRDVDTLEDVRASTGRIGVDVPAIDGDTTIATNTGRVDAAVGSDVDADLEVRTSTGQIDADLDLSDVDRSDDRLTGTLGDGGPTLRVETSAGRITLTTLE